MYKAHSNFQTIKHILLATILIIFSTSSCKDQPHAQEKIGAYALNGSPLYSSVPSEELLLKYEDHKQKYLSNVHYMESLIWYGRYAAYIGDYEEAIRIYSAGIKKHIRIVDYIGISDIATSLCENLIMP